MEILIILNCSISPFVAHILVNRKHVTVGTIGGDVTIFSRQPGPSEVEEALYTKVGLFIMKFCFQQK